jgi:chromosomal replication initiator protein
MKPDEQNAYWKECLSDIEKILSSQQFETWVRPLLFHSLIVLGDKAELKLTAPNKFKQRWVKEQLESTIQKWMEVKLKCYTRLIINVAESKSSRVIEKTTQNNLIKIKKDTKPIYNTRLNADCTFESFVLGKANQLARAAAQQICDNPGSSYNPFFLYGGVGLGKTHLIHAIGNTILERNSSASIRYIHAEAYVSDVVKAYQRKAFEEFKKTYHSLDILLIDDIQFLLVNQERKKNSFMRLKL